MKLPLIHTMVNATSYAAASEEVKNWAREGQSRYVCIANVHVLMEAHDSIDFRNAVNSSDLVTPDGMPLVWMLRLKGVKAQTRVYGPTLMLHVLKMAADERNPGRVLRRNPPTLETLVSPDEPAFPGTACGLRVQPALPGIGQGGIEQDYRGHDPVRCAHPLYRSGLPQTGTLDG